MRRHLRCAGLSIVSEKIAGSSLSPGRANRSQDHLDWAANRETEVAVRATWIDGDFNKPIRILVPERRTYRAIAERTRTLKHLTRHVARELGVSQPSISRMVASLRDRSNRGNGRSQGRVQRS
jgi:hypothetical protein